MQILFEHGRFVFSISRGGLVKEHQGKKFETGFYMFMRDTLGKGSTAPISVLLFSVQEGLNAN